MNTDSATTIALREAPRLPAAFPPVLDSPLAWSGSQFSSHSDYIVALDELDVREIEHALEKFKGTSVAHEKWPSLPDGTNR